MNLIEIYRRFPDHKSCIEHLEKVRWGDQPQCPYCNCHNVEAKQDGKRVGRWNCYGCGSSFNVLSGTIFQKTKIDFQKWFLAIGLILNAKKRLSSCQLARDLAMNQKSAWFMIMHIRLAMQQSDKSLLQSIVEMDECYVGGKPSKGNKRNDEEEGGNKSKRGRGTDKMPIVGAVKHGGNVVACYMDKKQANSKGLQALCEKAR